MTTTTNPSTPTSFTMAEDTKAYYLEQLGDPSWSVRAQAFGALAPLVSSDEKVKARVLELAGDPDGDVRAQAVGALAPLVSSDEKVKARVLELAKKGDSTARFIMNAFTDVMQILSAMPHEVRYLRDAIEFGKIDGSVYGGECACLMGTLAKARHCALEKLPVRTDASRPAERWFAPIKPGNTPKDNDRARAAFAWVNDFLKERPELLQDGPTEPAQVQQ